MNSADLEVLAAVYWLLFEPSLSARVSPNFTLREYLDFLLPYYERCLREDPKGERTHGRYVIGSDLANFTRFLWSEEETRWAVDEVRTFLSDLYKTADGDLRRCLVDATLEHLFEIEEIAESFEGWREDPELAIAFEEAKLWKEGLEEISHLPRQSAAEVAAQAQALEQDIARWLPPGSSKDAVAEFLQSRGLAYYDFPEKQFLTVPVPPQETGVAGGLQLLFWFDGSGKLREYRVATHADEWFPSL